MVRKSREETKEVERFLSMQLISQERDPAVEINGFEGIELEWLMPQQKNFLFPFLEESKILKGREGINLLVHAHCIIFLLFFCFLSYLFLFPCFPTFFLFYFFFSCSSPVFSTPFSGHSGGLLIAPAVTRFYYFALNHLCLVWVYLPTTTGLFASPSPSLDKEKAVLFIDLPWRPFLPRCRRFLSLSLMACT